MLLKVKILPARYGDCLWIEYTKSPTEVNKILIDGGTSGTRDDILRELKATHSKKHFDLCVVTHIDRDHIEGILSLLEKDVLDFTVGDFWFNGYKHLPENPNREIFGAVQGERLTSAILKHNISWNGNFKNEPVSVTDKKKLPVINLCENLKIILLSPSANQLLKLKKNWEAEVREANLVPGAGFADDTEKDAESTLEVFASEAIDVEALSFTKFVEDKAAANGSSIAFLIEFNGVKMLFTGDAHPSQILDSLNALYGAEEIKIDLWKISHHGGKGNTGPELLKRINCSRYILSTSGSRFLHPAPETIAWILKHKEGPAELFFNYRSDQNKIWDEEELKKKYAYSTVYPNSSSGIEITL